MPTQSDPSHEALCRRCGRCCYEKFIVDGHVFTTRTPCRYLDVKTNLCTIYEKRFQVNPHCLDIPGGIAFSAFPADCPYVRGRSDYMPSEEGWLEDDVARQVERGLLRTCRQVLEAMQRTERKSGQ